jgi:hypothetical protein
MRVQGCQMVYFQMQNSNLDKFWRTLDWKMLMYFMDIWNISRTFGIFYDRLVHFVFILVHISGFGIVHQEKSGNPGCDSMERKVEHLLSERIPEIQGFKFCFVNSQTFFCRS